MRNLFLAFLLAVAAIAGAAAQEETPEPAPSGPGGAKGLEVFGYILEKASVVGAEDGSVLAGNALSARFKANWPLSDRLSFFSEFRVLGSFGADNAAALARSYGLPVPSTEDEHWSLEVDHLYGRANFGVFDLSFGKLPVAWGTSYVFNPTAKAYSAASLDYSSEETPGTLAIAPSLVLGPALSVSGYLAFQDRLSRSGTDIAEGEFMNLPFGVKATGILGSFDVSVSFIKEVLYDGTGAAYRRRAYIGADFAGAVWDFGVYGEAALGLPDSVADGTGPSDFDLGRDLEAAVGFDYTFLDIEVETRAEYYYRGEGAGRKEDYDASELLTGSSSVLGRHYLFLYASRVTADYFKLTLAALANLGDGSWMLLPEIAWDAASDLEVKLGAYVPLGSRGSEYDGRFDLSGLGLGEVDLITPRIHASVKLSF